MNRNHLLILLILGILLTSPGLAAKSVLSGRSIGIRGGLGVSDFLGEERETDNQTINVRFTGAAFCRLPLRPDLSLQLEAALVQKGGKWSRDDWFFGKSYQVDESVSLLYLDVPLLLRLNLKSAPDRHVAVYAGPGVSLMLHGTRSGEVSGGGSTSLLQSDYSGPVGNLKRFNLDLKCGFDYSVLVAPNRYVTFDIRYSVALTRVAHDMEPGETPGDDEIPLAYANGEALDLYNEAIMLTVAMGFPW